MSLGVTRTFPFPHVSRQDNPYPGNNDQLRRYWEKPCPIEGAKLARLDIVQSVKYTIGDLSSATVTLVDVNANEVVRDFPLTLLVIDTKGLRRPRYWKPFEWDPMKSWVSPLGGLVLAFDIDFLAYYVRP